MSDTKPINSNACVFSPHDVTLLTVESFIHERNVYEEAINARNIVLKAIDRSRPAHTNAEISNAEAAVASARVPRNGSESLPTFPIASDASRILGHVPIGYARGDAGGTYAHPRYEVANETGDAADCTPTTTIQLASEPPATDLYLAKRICNGEITLKGRSVMELACTCSGSGADEGLPATSLALSSIVANRMGARLTVVLASSVSPAGQGNAKKEIPQNLVDTIEHNVWSRQGEQEAKATASCEERDENQMNDSKESIAEADNKEARTTSRGSNIVVRSFALGESADTKNILSTLVHNVGFDVVLAAIPTSIWSNLEENETRKGIERVLTTISACLSKDRSAAALVCFDRSAHCFAQFIDEICGELGLDFVKIDEASVVSNLTTQNSSTVVVCYKFFLRLDEAGLPLDPFQSFDVVVQGTGMSESFLSAALARAGKKVLHVDAGSNYGGSAFASLDLGSFHRQYCLPLKPDGSYGDGHKQFYGSAIGENCYHQVHAKLLTNRIFVDGVDGEEKTPVLSEREVRQTMIDAVPLYCFSRGPLINTLVDGRAGRNLEFMTVDRVVIIEPHKKDKASSPSQPPSTPQPSVESNSSPSGGLAARRALLAAKRMAKTASESVSNAAISAMATTSNTAHTFAAKLVPFSRSDVFRGGNSLFSNPLEARRAMKFFKDLEKSFDHTAEDSGNENELDKRVEMARQAEREKSSDENGDDQAAGARNQKSRVLCADGETYRHPLPWEEVSQDQSEPLEVFLSRHYGLSASTIDLLTMGGALVPYAFSLAREKEGVPTTTLSASINLVRTSLASVGRFGVGDTPLLCPMYGAGEVPQNMCRISAVWDATFILRRCVRGLFSCSESDHGNKCVILSNGQRIQTKAVVLPREIAECRRGGGLLRSVMVLSSPFISWKQLEDCCSDQPPSDDSVEEANQRELRNANKFPVMLGIIAGSDKTQTPPIVIHQVGASTGHAPYAIQRSLPGTDENDESRLTIVHFSADCKTMSREMFEETINSLITSTDPSEASKGETGVFSILSSAILYHATFIIEAETVAEHSCGGPVFRSLLVGDSVGHKDNPGSIFTTSSLLVPSTANPICAADSQDSIGDASNSKDMQTLKASGVSSLLNDSSYVCEAIALYKRIMNHLRSEQSVAPEAQTTTSVNTMPFLYKLPDPAGRASDDDEDCENHASYAQRLLTDAKGEPSATLED